MFEKQLDLLWPCGIGVQQGWHVLFQKAHLSFLEFREQNEWGGVLAVVYGFMSETQRTANLKKKNSDSSTALPFIMCSETL